MNIKLSSFMLGALMLTSLNEASAFSRNEAVITDNCASLGYDLLPEYQADSCNSCHSDSQAKAAFASGDYEYFCAVVPDTPVCTDEDGDGFFVEGESCGSLADFDDSNATAYPGAAEICTDGIDNDGNGLTDAADPNAVNCSVACTDNDMDGYATEGGECGAIDCNDDDASINPGATEICSDAIDNNCNGLVDTADMNAVDCSVECTDNDADGYSVEGGSCGAMDCDDANADVNPGALEICGDNIDNNCNGSTDDMDAVCQDDSNDDDDCRVPWWRKHHWRNLFPRIHQWKCDKSNNDESEEDESDEDELD